MKKIVRNAKGFTLVELMIVVAIIGILAAIAIPQFAAYRIRGFNSSAQSDIKNLATSEAAFFADWNSYGVSQETAGNLTFTPAAGTNGGGGAAVLGGDANADGIALTIGANDRGIGISVGNLVTVIADTDAPGAGIATTSFTMVSKHQQGDTTFGMDNDATSVFQCPGTNAAAACYLAVGAAVAATPGVTANTVDFTVDNGWVAK